MKKTLQLIGEGVAVGALAVAIIFAFGPPKKYIYDDEARLVGYCNGQYLIREEEDEFPDSGCYFIEPIAWDGGNA